MNKHSALVGVVATLLLVLASGWTAAQEPGPEGSAEPNAALGTAFTYQGRLQKDGQSIDDACDMRFSLWDALSGGNQIGTAQSRMNVPIVEGLFTVADLDFGSGAFRGDARWLQVAVQCSGETSFTVLSPRQALTATPYASYAGRVGAHSHLGQTWTGSDNPLKIAGSFGGAADGAALVLSNDDASGAGLRVLSGYNGVYVDSAGGDGVYVGSAGIDGVRVDSAGIDGVDVYAAGDDGVVVGSAGGDGVRVGSAGNHGVVVASANWDGVFVDSAGGDGVYVSSAAIAGLAVYSAGSPSTATPSSEHNGFEVAGAEGDGLYVGRADYDGVRVGSAGDDGVYVYVAADDGVYVNAAGDRGVYANTLRSDQEWGFYTPDKIYAGSGLASGGPSMIVAQNGDSAPLEPGTVVVVSGLGAPFAESDFPAPLVRRTGPGGGAVLGVVYARYVAEEEVEEVGHDGQTEQRTSQHSQTGDGPIAPGDYLLVVVLGPAQVKAVALAGGIRPGDLLVMGTDGAAARIESGTAYLPGSIVGMAMEGLGTAKASGLVWVLVQPR